MFPGPIALGQKHISDLLFFASSLHRIGINRLNQYFPLLVNQKINIGIAKLMQEDGNKKSRLLPACSEWFEDILLLRKIWISHNFFNLLSMPVAVCRYEEHHLISINLAKWKLIKM